MRLLCQIGVGILDVPFTPPAASAKTAAGVSPLRVHLPPALLAVAPVLRASQDATVLRADAESGPIALGTLGRNRLPGVALGQALQRGRVFTRFHPIPGQTKPKKQG